MWLQRLVGTLFSGLGIDKPARSLSGEEEEPVSSWQSSDRQADNSQIIHVLCVLKTVAGEVVFPTDTFIAVTADEQVPFMSKSGLRARTKVRNNTGAWSGHWQRVEGVEYELRTRNSGGSTKSDSLYIPLSGPLQVAASTCYSIEEWAMSFARLATVRTITYLRTIRYHTGPVQSRTCSCGRD